MAFPLLALAASFLGSKLSQANERPTFDFNPMALRDRRVNFGPSGTQQGNQLLSMFASSLLNRQPKQEDPITSAFLRRFQGAGRVLY